MVQLHGGDGRDGRDTTSLGILADILGYRAQVFTRTVFSKRARQHTRGSVRWRGRGRGTNPMERVSEQASPTGCRGESEGETEDEER